MQNKDLSLEIATLKVALAKSKEEMRRNLEDVKDQKEDMTKREIEVGTVCNYYFVETKLGNELCEPQHINIEQSGQCLSVTFFSTDGNAKNAIHCGGELSATNKFLQEKVMEYQEKENKLSQQLAETRDSAELAKIDLETLQKKLTEVEGSSSLTYQYLLEEASKTYSCPMPSFSYVQILSKSLQVKQQKADLRCELLELRRDYNRQKEKLEKLEAKSVDESEIEKLRCDLESCRKREERLQKEVERLKEALGKAEEEREQLEMELKSTRDEAGEASVEQKFNQELREELKKTETKLLELSKTMEIVDSQCEQFRELKKRAEVGRQNALSECAEMTTKVRNACFPVPWTVNSILQNLVA
ncbi:unnamed protein product [Cylicostephanus goldi]|uniref:Uncharacterized protein n=1 Tax=Cylicostephanus goldi TaxID=71465 RepID=A0A3P6QJ46_CYLGO|nr:unnamed protein product [Cylicostephanus goldi]